MNVGKGEGTVLEKKENKPIQLARNELEKLFKIIEVGNE